MKFHTIQAASAKPFSRSRRSLAMALLVASFLLTAPFSDVSAAWGGGYKACLKTKIADVSHLTITEGAEALGLSVLVSVLPDAVADLLDSSEGITVFAPTDEAFGNIPGDILSAIAADEAVLTKVLAYHVSPKKVDPRRAWRIRKVDTLAEQTLFVSRSRAQPTINQSKAECQGYRTANGLVWVIDSVLLPQF